MKNKTKNVLLISFGIVLILTVSILSYETISFINYWCYNPPITRYSDKLDYSDDIGLVSHWDFEEINSKIINDKSGNNNFGKTQSILISQHPKQLLNSILNLNGFWSTPKIVKGIKGNAIKINGRQMISGGNKKAYNTNTFTIATWVWRENDNDRVPTIMAKGSWPYDGWWLCTKPYTKYIDMGIAWGDSYKHIESGYELALQEWHHIAVTMDNVEHEIKFFIDGKQYGDTHENIQTWLINWNHDLFIGGYDGSGRWPWPGKFDEARYYDRILSDEEIFNIYRM